MVGALLALLLWQANVVVVVVLAGLAGLALYRRPEDRRAADKQGPGQDKGQGGAR
jgi:hypothetical protein